VKDLEKKLDNEEWQDANGSLLNRRRFCSKIRYMFNKLNTLKGKIEMNNKINEPQSMSMDIMNIGGSQNSRRISQSVVGKGKRNIPKQAKSSKKKGGRRLMPLHLR